MPTTVSNGLRRVADRLSPDPAPDGELLARYAIHSDEAAFATLVRRHAAMVFGTCRRILGNAADADDAFQATFVVLVRKAHSFIDRACVGNFLYGIAYRTALKARSMALKRRLKEAQVKASQASPDQTELLKVLDEELARLPEKYREPVVLCELEGLSRRDVASALGVAEGTVSSRLATAHRILEKRLKERGFASVCVATVLAGQVFAVTDSLADTAIRGVVEPSARISQLASEVTKMFLLHKLGLGVAVLLIAIVSFSLYAAMPYDVPAVEKPQGIRGDEPKVAPRVAQVEEPAWKADFRKSYGLKEGELIRRVAPPYPDCRVEYFRDRTREVYRQNKLEPQESEVNKDYADHFTKLGWKDGWTVDGLISQVVPIKPEVGIPLIQALKVTSGFLKTRIEGDPELLEQKITGDFVVRAGADPEKLIVELEKILRKECELPVTFTFHEVERDVLVLSGRYEPKPLPDRKKNEIEVYAFMLSNRESGGGGVGDLQNMIEHIEGEFINAHIALGEIKNAPKQQLEWHFNYRSPFTEAEHAQDTDPEGVMNNIAAQTGLTLKVEKRKLKILEVKKKL